MRKLFTVIAFTSCSLLSTVQASEILDDFKSKGYHELLNTECGQEQFSQIYGQLDTLIEFVEKHPEWTQKLYAIDQEFTQSPANSLYGNPPIGFINDSKSGKTKKNYFHFTREYYHFIMAHHAAFISESEAMTQLLQSLSQIARISEAKFEDAIASIGEEVNIAEAMHTHDGQLLPLIKVVRYEASSLPASNPHFDFSGLSFLFDNSEVETSESLLIAPYKENLTLSDFSHPRRNYHKTSSESSLLLIPGLALRHLDFPIDPIPHAVPKQDKQRYAIIVFAMAPYVKLTYDAIKVKQIKLPELQ